MKKPVDADRLKRICRDLIQAVHELHQVEDEFRSKVSQIAGCDVSEWPLQTCCNYVDAGWDYLINARLQPIVEGIRQAQIEMGLR